MFLHISDVMTLMVAALTAIVSALIHYIAKILRPVLKFVLKLILIISKRTASYILKAIYYLEDRKRTDTAEAAPVEKENEGSEDAFCSDLYCVRCHKPSSVLSKALERIREIELEGDSHEWAVEERESLLELERTIYVAVDKMALKKNGRIYEYPGKHAWCVINATNEVLLYLEI